ncbi:hypothetical protein H5410_030947 [Solanum commersonii]|uniref:PB1-like domain-containing protein n=1 Tax=Solanum commersonii TaxID=4109 RepID=A0A9J5YH33_SOLCO|nr:hypothetical protein H5410_030947 [Solanum commersonii]
MHVWVNFSRASVGQFHSSKSSRIVVEFEGMSGFTFITLKLYHGGALLYEGEEARYVGGLVSEYVNVDVDIISYFEIKDYVKELGYSPNCKFSIRPPNNCILGYIDNDDILLAMCNCLQNGVVLDVYVHMPEEESGATFNKVGTIENRTSENIEYIKVDEAAFNEAIEYSVKGSDESTEESDDSEDSELLEDDQYGSVVHEELIQLRAEKRSFLRRRKKRERIHADTEEFDETTIYTNTLEGRLRGDEPYYASSDACSFETDTDDSCLKKGEKMRLKLPNTKRKKYTTDSVRFDPNSKKIVWQLGMDFESVKDFRLAVTKYAIQTRVQIEKCDELLRSNPGSTCVVKLGEADESACEERRCARHILANWLKNWKGLQRKKLFWKCAKSNFEAKFRENLQELSKLGTGIVDDLIYYDKEYWCKVYFNCEVKSDVIDSIMCESFNA